MTWEEARHEIELHLAIMYPFNTPRDVLKVAHEALGQPKITRCKDCKWGEPTRNGKGEEMVFCYCGDTGIEDGWLLNPDWYCAEGEPKDGDGE